ncbi:MAG TPA: hypothetical protein VME41_10325 [Stellaceae bacterium]|nr:hypothetical protein [Stellaceae bacterium]
MRCDLREPRGSDYDAFYRMLDLPPGAPLAAIEDAARLLRTAFQPEGLPASLKRQTQARAQAIARARGELRRFWRTHHKPPPSADLRGAAGLLDALVEALGKSGAATANASAAPALPAVPAASPAGGGRAPPWAAEHTAGSAQRPLPVARPATGDGVVRLPAARRLHRIELAAVLHGDQVFAVVERPGRPLLPPPSRPLPPVVAGPARDPVPPPLITVTAPPRRDAVANLRGIAVKLGAVGLAIAFAALLQHYAFGIFASGGAVHAPSVRAIGAPATSPAGPDGP